jgi:hypothetical protein
MQFSFIAKEIDVDGNNSFPDHVIGQGSEVAPSDILDWRSQLAVFHLILGNGG